jgi:membrane protease YdiL (CAAX protease family)
LENLEQPSPQQSPTIVSPIPPTFFEEVSLFIQRMPAWLFATLSLAGLFVSYQFIGGGLMLVLFGMNPGASNVVAYRWATMLGQIFFLLAPTVVLARLRFPNVKNVFRFGAFNVKEILLVLVAVFALQQLMQGYLTLQESVPISFPPVIQKLVDQVKEMMEEMYRMLTTAHSIPEFLFVVIVIAATPAVCEELLFRGLIQRTLEDADMKPSSSFQQKENRGLIAAIVAGIIFALYHLNPFTLVPLAALGIFFGFVVYRTQNILTSMVAHFFNNFLACLAVYLNLDDSFIAIAPTSQPSTSFLIANFIICAVVFVATTYYLVRVTNRPTTS